MTHSDIERVVRTYSGMVFSIAFQQLGNRNDAEDMTQEVFLKLMDQKDFQSEDHLKHWLIRVTINHCKDQFKTSWKKHVDLSSERWIPTEDRQALDELMELPPEDRNILYLSYYHGYKAKEISELLKITPENVRKKIQRAKEKLKVVMLEGGEI